MNVKNWSMAEVYEMLTSGRDRVVALKLTTATIIFIRFVLSLAHQNSVMEMVFLEGSPLQNKST